MNRAALQLAGSEQSAFAGTQRFQVLACVGRGASGVVYEVHDRERDARLALKALHAPTAEAILLLKNEFRSVQDVRHRNLVELHELFEEKGQWFFTMEFVPGCDFLTYVRGSSAAAALASGALGEQTNTTLDESRLRAVLGQMAQGLSALHRAQKVHRDVKPSNVQVTADGRVVILDFGIVSEVGRDAGREGIVGTVYYMAPEQALGEQTGPAADWYALGVMLYQALTGRVPFMGLGSDVIEQKVTVMPPAPKSFIGRTGRSQCVVRLADEHRSG